MAPRWTNTHNAHISHTLMALDLILFHLWWKTQHIKKKKKKVGWWGGVPFFADEMKSSCCSDLSKQAKVQRWVRLPGDFFSLCSLSNYTVEEGNIRRGGGGGRWYSTAEVRKMDILRERETKREWLQKVPYLWCSACTFCCIMCHLLPNLEIIRQRVLNGARRLKRLIGSGHSNTEFTWVEWDWEAGRRYQHQGNIWLYSSSLSFSITSFSLAHSPPSSCYSLLPRPLHWISLPFPLLLFQTRTHKLQSQFNHRLKMTAGHWERSERHCASVWGGGKER